MSRVVSLRLNEVEDARMSGAAVLHGFKSLPAYIKWLAANGYSSQHAGNEMVLHRLDELAASVADVRTTLAEKKRHPVIDLPPRTVIATRLKERGLPSSTIRQVEAVLDELGVKPAQTTLPL